MNPETERKFAHRSPSPYICSMKLPQEKIEKILPFVLSMLLSSVGIVINASIDRMSWQNIVFQWLFYVSILLISWFVNLKISAKPFPLILLFNVIVVFMGGISAKHLFNTSMYAVPIIRFIMPSVAFVILQQYFSSLKQSEQLKIENLQLKAENYQAELENLKKQLNPHFLFNSLTTLQTIMRSEVEIAEKYVIHLAEVYRKMLQGSQTSTTTLKEELAFIESYFFLLKTRFENGIALSVEISPSAYSYRLPIFALQLLLENCIKHNIVSEEKPLIIKLFQKEEVSITLSNTYQPKHKKAQVSGIGLTNLKRRYELMGIENGVTIEQNEEVYCVTLTLF